MVVFLAAAPARRRPRVVHAAMPTFVETDNNRTVDIRQGETVEITLIENATTGYRWSVENYTKGVFDAEERVSRYPKKAIGSGGEVTFAFKAKARGTGEIALKHWRDWEGEASVIGRFRLHVKIA